MTTHNVLIALPALRAALTHAADGDVRYYLNGILLELPAGRMVATDGHRLLVCTGPQIDAAQLGDLPAQVILPRDLVERALKAYTGLYKRAGKLGDVNVPVTITAAAAGKPPTITINLPDNGSVTGPAIDGQFPDWRRVLPKWDALGEQTLTQCNPQYVFDAHDAIACYRNEKYSEKSGIMMYQRGAGPSVFTDGTDGVLVIVMPLRVNDPLQPARDACGWAHADTADTGTAAA
jgi:hypothetical protein